MAGRLAAHLIAVVIASAAALAQQNRVDVLTPLAPELAAYGSYAIGVRTIQALDRNRPDIVHAKAGEPTPRYDRPFTLEIWYPAAISPAQKPGGDYNTITRRPSVNVTLHGRAVRDAAPLKPASGFPLVIVSHGHPGNRYLLSHLTESLASKGFVVVAIDHSDSTYADDLVLASSLYNRPLDDLFVLNEVARLGSSGSGSFLSGLVDAAQTGIVGYSLGGYGVVNLVGGGLSEASATQLGAPPNRLLADRAATNPEYRRSVDPRIKAAIAIGPWGMTFGLWDAEGLKGIRTPLLLVAGSADDVSGYEKGTRAIFKGAVNTDRYLLTFVNAGHNAGAPIPAPIETYPSTEENANYPFAHYADPVWDTARMNNILDHFATAYFSLYLKGDQEKKAYLELIPIGKDGVYSIDRDGKAGPTHTYWKGFKRGTAVGLMLEHLAPGQ